MDFKAQKLCKCSLLQPDNISVFYSFLPAPWWMSLGTGLPAGGFFHWSCFLFFLQLQPAMMSWQTKPVQLSVVRNIFFPLFSFCLTLWGRSILTENGLLTYRLFFSPLAFCQNRREGRKKTFILIRQCKPSFCRLVCSHLVEDVHPFRSSVTEHFTIGC